MAESLKRIVAYMVYKWMVGGTHKSLNWTGGGAARTEDGGNTTSWVQAAIERRRRQL